MNDELRIQFKTHHSRLIIHNLSFIIHNSMLHRKRPRYYNTIVKVPAGTPAGQIIEERFEPNKEFDKITGVAVATNPKSLQGVVLCGIRDTTGDVHEPTPIVQWLANKSVAPDNKFMSFDMECNRTIHATVIPDVLVSEAFEVHFTWRLEKEQIEIARI